MGNKDRGEGEYVDHIVLRKFNINRGRANTYTVNVGRALRSGDFACTVRGQREDMKVGYI